MLSEQSLWSLIHRLHVKWIRKLLDTDNKVYYYDNVNWGELDEEAKEILNELVDRSIIKWEKVKLVKAEWEIKDKLI